MAELITEVLGPVDKPPGRRPGSVRRTSTLFMTWPDGILHGMRLAGRCRDLLTPTAGETRVLAQHDLLARATLDRTIQSAEADPAEPRLSKLTGARAGGALRGVLSDVVPDLRDAGAPLYLLLDDLAGASLVGGFVFIRWRDALPELAELRRHLPMRSMEGICSGFRPGASSLHPDGTQTMIPHRVARVPSLADPEDPWSWHEMPVAHGLAMRRARRVDVWFEDGELQIDSMFRDSCWEPDGTEIAVHEYHLVATADAASGLLTTVRADPRVLPYAECPLAANNVGLVEGVPLAELRREVLERIRKTDCCTHLNDALRALAEVPVLAAFLTEA
jgi:hypothetical protein